MQPKQNPKKTRGKGGKKERKRRDEMKKYALIVTQESQLGNEINHNKQRLNDICEKFSNCCMTRLFLCVARLRLGFGPSKG